MCDICWHTPCHPRCPNAPDQPILTCWNCGREIYDEEDIREINGEHWCPLCAEEDDEE